MCVRETSESRQENAVACIVSAARTVEQVNSPRPAAVLDVTIDRRVASTRTLFLTSMPQATCIGVVFLFLDFAQVTIETSVSLGASALVCAGQNIVFPFAAFSASGGHRKDDHRERQSCHQRKGHLITRFLLLRRFFLRLVFFEECLMLAISVSDVPIADSAGARYGRNGSD